MNETELKLSIDICSDESIRKSTPDNAHNRPFESIDEWLVHTCTWTSEAEPKTNRSTDLTD